MGYPLQVPDTKELETLALGHPGCTYPMVLTARGDYSCRGFTQAPQFYSVVKERLPGIGIVFPGCPWGRLPLLMRTKLTA
jgi:hypothetical protein